MKALLIPARYDSSRFPAKPLASILGTPMIVRTAQQAFQAKGFDFYGVVTDHEEIYQTVVDHGLNALMSPTNCLTGADRLFWAAQEIGAKYIVNCQGDEPTIDPLQLQKLLEFGLKYPSGWVTGHAPLGLNKLSDPNCVKIQVDQKGNVLDFFRDGREHLDNSIFRHIGIYGYSFEELKFFSQRPQTREELKLSLEQLRIWPEIDIHSVELAEPGLSVDTPADLIEVENLLLDRV